MSGEGSAHPIIGRFEGEPVDVVKPELNLAALTFYIDVHIIDDKSAAVAELTRARSEGWIRIQKTDTLDTELMGKQDAVVREELLCQSRPFAESVGPLVLSHSRNGHVQLANPNDARRIGELFKILFPGSSRERPNLQSLRDTMHIATAIKYCGDAFITREKRLLNKSDRVFEAHQLRILTPEEAMAVARLRIGSVVRRRHVTGMPGWIPTWIPEDC